jgi:DegV family protein with EDD domain
VYEKLSVDYDQIISIHVSSKVSLTCENAREAVVRGRQKYFFNCYRTKRNFNTFAIHVVDSQSVSIGNGLLSIKAAQWVEEGLEAEEIVDRLRGLASKVSVFVAPKNLSFLRRSKRVGALKFLIGNLLGISPVLCFQNGTMDLHNSVRGVDRAVNLIVEKTKTDVDIPSCPLIGIARSGNLADASIRKFTRDLQISDNENDQFVSQIGATITSHTGPESLAVAFVRK